VRAHALGEQDLAVTAPVIRPAGYAHLLLTEHALRCRSHSEELALASRAARKNAEALEEIICNGTEAEVLEALKLVGDVQ